MPPPSGSRSTAAHTAVSGGEPAAGARQLHRRVLRADKARRHVAPHSRVRQPPP